MTSCTAAKCRVQAITAVQWVAGYGTRAEPICLGHMIALTPFVAGRGRQARFLTLAEYAARLAREPTTIRVGRDDLIEQMRGMTDAFSMLRPNTR